MIIDSSLSDIEAVQCDADFPCPHSIIEGQKCIDIIYYSFDGHEHMGQLVVHASIVPCIQTIFATLREHKFPIAQVIPIADTQFCWNDERSMRQNNTSGFNYRTIAGTDNLSWHAYGLAVDINPLLNPYIINGEIHPQGAKYNERVPGTITANSLVVKLFKEHGFIWGGDWIEKKDYQHFEKHLPM